MSDTVEKNTWRARPSLGLAVVFACVCCAVAFAAPETDGTLDIEGKGISTLVLQGKRSLKLSKPGAQVSLPAGRYSVKEIVLTGGQSTSDVASLPEITIEQGKTTRLKAGAPLNNDVVPERFFNLLRFNYRLTGIGGEIYRPSSFAKRPAFKVYQGKRLLGSDVFEFG